MSHSYYFFLSCHNSYIRIFAGDCYLHMTRCILMQLIKHVRRCTYDARTFQLPKRAGNTRILSVIRFQSACITNVSYATNNLSNAMLFLSCRRRVNNERREKRTTVYYTRPLTRKNFNARIANITFLCDSYFQESDTKYPLVFLSCLLLFLKRNARIANSR